MLTEVEPGPGVGQGRPGLVVHGPEGLLQLPLGREQVGAVQGVVLLVGEVQLKPVVAAPSR